MAAYYPNGLVPHELRCPHTPAELRPMLCAECTADEAYRTYKALKLAYYGGQPLCDDNRYDLYEMLCRIRWPEDERFHRVGEIDDRRT
jgi:hypothetical protein